MNDILNNLPDADQMQKYTRDYIFYLSVNNPDSLNYILRKNGVVLTSPTAKELFTATYRAMLDSERFKADLKNLMAEHAAQSLDIPDSGNMLNKDELFGNVVNTAPAGDTSSLMKKIVNTGTNSGTNSGNTYQTNNTATNTKKAFGDTAVGGFLSNLFTKENINKAVGTGLDIVNQKLVNKGNEQVSNAAIEVERLKAQQAAAQAMASGSFGNTGKKLSTGAIIGISLGVIGLTVLVIYLVKKKK